MKTELLTINYKKFIILLTGCLLAFVVIAGVAFAQADAVTKYGITFPIAELGNCSDYGECRDYCEDPINASSCVDYAKAKGFYQEDPLITAKDKILQAAKAALGCDGYESCLNYCEVPANYDKCHSFAEGQGLSGGVVANPTQTIILQRAQQVLGCTSVDECKSYCDQEANRSKCSDFAKQAGLRGGEHAVGPGGCTSESTCQTFCSDPNNFQICSGFMQSSGGTFAGPGGCSSASSCATYCQQNPQDCGYQGQGGIPPGSYNPQDMCNRTPNCSWVADHCQCSGISGTGATYPQYTPAPGYTPPPGYTPQPGYTPPSGYSYPSYTPSSGYNYPSYTPPSSYDQGAYTPPPTTSYESPPPPSDYQPPPSPTYQYSSPSPTGTTQGASTAKGLLQILLDWLRGI